MKPIDARWTVEGYAPTSCGGALLLSTWHKSEWGKDTEVSVWLERRRRGEVGRIVVRDHELASTKEL